MRREYPSAQRCVLPVSFSVGCITMVVTNQPEKKLEKRTSVQCFNLEKGEKLSLSGIDAFYKWIEKCGFPKLQSATKCVTLVKRMNGYSNWISQNWNNGVQNKGQ